MGFNTALIAALLFLLCTCTRAAPTRRPPPPSDNNGEEPKQEGQETLQATAEMTKTSAREATQAGTIMKTYLVSTALIVKKASHHQYLKHQSSSLPSLPRCQSISMLMNPPPWPHASLRKGTQNN